MTPAISLPVAPEPDNSTPKIHAAARDFEALLITQMLRSMHQEGGWLSSGSDSGDDADDSAIGLGEEELARSLSASGGMGLARMIETGLAKPAAQSPEESAPGEKAPGEKAKTAEAAGPG